MAIAFKMGAIGRRRGAIKGKTVATTFRMVATLSTNDPVVVAVVVVDPVVVQMVVVDPAVDVTVE